MARVEITQFFVYRWRYIVGYGLVSLLLSGLLIFAGLFVPGGLSDAEMQAAIVSDSLSFTDMATYSLANLPYYALQSVTFDIFGVSTFTIKLPSLILAFLSAIGLILLLRRWFKPNIAVLASLIAVTTGQFLFIAQNGTPGILYVFWPVALLLLGTQITRGKYLKALWKILFGVTAALSLYTPLSIYPLIAIMLATLLHPHLRTAVRRLSKWLVAVAIVVTIAALLPLGLGIWKSPELGLTLLGVPSTFPPDLLANAVTLLKQYFLFWEPSTTTLMTPVFGLGSVLILGLGLYRLFMTRETTRSYLIIFWLICLVPVLLLNPDFTSVTFVPSVLLLAAGFTSLVMYWYRLFPRNPYARITGLIPLIILVAVLIGSGIDRYIYGYRFDPHTAANFSKDLRLLPKDTQHLVTGVDEKPFYDVVANHRTSLTVSTEPTGDQFIATRAAKKEFDGYVVESIITGSTKENADRLYIYKKTTE